MADKKISDLPVSTTPLVGTEVIPIVQSGATKKVSVNDLTDGKDVDVRNLFVSTLTDGRVVVVDDNGQLVDNANLVFDGQSVTVKGFNGQILNLIGTNTGFGQSSKIKLLGNSTDTLGLLISKSGSGSSSPVARAEIINEANSDFRLGSNNTPHLIIRGNGNITVSTGNLVIGTSGKGIDFSADGSAAGMTSELLDDYEEGTWTPEYVPLSGSFATMTYSARAGYYTKVGRFVFVTCRMLTSDVDITGAASILTIQGLPFAPISGVAAGTISVGSTRSWNVSTGIETIRGIFNAGRIELTKNASNSAYAQVVPSDLLTGANSNSNELTFSGFYITG